MTPAACLRETPIDFIFHSEIGIPRSQPEPVREHVSAWRGGSLHPLLPLSPAQRCFQERVCSLSLRDFPPPSSFSPPRQSSNRSRLRSSARAFFQGVAGRGELVPLSLISCCMAPMSQIKFVSSPLFALQRWKAGQLPSPPAGSSTAATIVLSIFPSETVPALRAREGKRTVYAVLQAERREVPQAGLRPGCQDLLLMELTRGAAASALAFACFFLPCWQKPPAGVGAAPAFSAPELLLGKGGCNRRRKSSLRLC